MSQKILNYLSVVRGDLAKRKSREGTPYFLSQGRVEKLNLIFSNKKIY